MSITLFEVLKQLFRKPATNEFPEKHAPDNMHAKLPLILEGKITLPVNIDEKTGKYHKRFRGKIEYDRTACIGCKMCIKVCPAEAIEYVEPTEEELKAWEKKKAAGEVKGKVKGKVKFYMTRCTFCAFCTDACPKGCIRMGNDVLTNFMATTDRFGTDALGRDLIVTDSGNFTADEDYNPDDYY